MTKLVFSCWAASLCLAACLAMPAALAAELGEISVQSHMGQPLSVDIELTALAPDELPGLPVRLASGNVYEGGGISMDAALQSLVISQSERDGRRFVHLSTRQPINAGHVHLYLMLGNGNRSIVRLATVWLTPAPPAPVVAPAPRVLPPPAAPVPAPVPASKPAVVPDAAALAARARAEGMLRPSAVFVAPPVAARPAPAPVAPPLRRTPAPAPAPAPVAACAPQSAGVPAAACVALDRQNTALNDKIGVLEGKVSALQQALAAPAAAATAVASAPHAKAKAVPAEKKTGGLGLWWLALGSLLFLLVTAVIVYLLRKRKGRAQAGPAAPSKYWVLLRKPFRRKPAPVAPPGEAPPERDEPALAPEPEPEPFSR